MVKKTPRELVESALRCFLCGDIDKGYEIVEVIKARKLLTKHGLSLFEGHLEDFGASGMIRKKRGEEVTVDEDALLVDINEVMEANGVGDDCPPSDGDDEFAEAGQLQKALWVLMRFKFLTEAGYLDLTTDDLGVIEDVLAMSDSEKAEANLD